MSFGIKRVLKKTLKIILILCGSAVLLIGLIFLLLAIPAVQASAGHKAAAYLSHKTGAFVSIDRFHFTAGGKISLSKVLIKDQKNDTILFAGKIITGVYLTELLNKNIRMRSTSLEHIRAKIFRPSGDSLYNFSFIINAFSGNKTDTSSGNSGFRFFPGDLHIHDLSCSYLDSLSGIFSNASLDYLSFSPKKIDFSNLFFNMNELIANGLNGNLLISKKNNESSNTESSSPRFFCSHIALSNSSFTYADSTEKTVFRFLSGELRSEKSFLSLEKIFFSAEKFELSNGGFWYSYAEQTDTAQKKTTEKNGNTWMLKVAAINLKNNQAHINNVKKPVVKQQFDYEHLNVSALSAQAKSSIFSGQLIAVQINAFSAKTEDDFEIRNGSGLFKMQGNTIITKELAVKTKYSSLKASSQFDIPSGDSTISLQGDINAGKLYTGDILYFAPQLRSEVFFSNADNYSRLKASLVTRNGKLFINDFDLSTASRSNIKLKGSILNFQQPSQAFYDIQKLDILSSASDIRKMQLDKFIPASIHLPDSIHIASAFRGEIKNFNTESSLESSFGNMNIKGGLDKDQNFSGTLNLNRLNLPAILGSANLPGPVTLTATAKGHGLDTSSFQMDLETTIPSIVFNHYNWQNINVKGHITDNQYGGEFRLNDPNAEVIAKGIINLKKGQEQYQLTADVKGADLEKLKLTGNDYKVAFSVNADLKGNSMYNVNGNAGVTGIIISHNEKKYFLDSLLFATVNRPGENKLSLRSPVVNINYAGTFAPNDLVKEMKQYFNSYFKAFDMKGDTTLSKQHFELSIQMHDHPVLSEVFFPKLKIFEPGDITGKFDGDNRKLDFNLDLPRLEYGDFSVNKLKCAVNADESQIKYKISAFDLSNSNLSFQNFQVSGNTQDQKILTNISSVDDNKNKKLFINTILSNEKEGQKFSIDPSGFVIMGKSWSISPDNFILFHKGDFQIHKMDFNSGSGTIDVESVNDKMDDDILIRINNFDPIVFSDIVRKDSAWLEGNMNGEILLKRRDKNFGIVAKATIDSLRVNQVGIGNLKLNGNQNADTYDISLELKGTENEVSIKGNYSAQQNASNLRLNSQISKMSMRTFEAFFPKDVKETEGNISGNISISGNVKNPILNGKLNFDNVYFNPEATNSRLNIRNQNIQLKNNTLIFESFTIKDASDHEAVINGNVSMKDNVPAFSLNMHTQDFMILNTPHDAKKEFYGRLVADSRINLKGNLNFPVITSSVKIKNKSNFTFAVPEDRMSADRGEDVVIFEDSLKLNRILRRNDEKDNSKSNIKNLNISSTIEIDKKAVLRILIDPISHDSLVMKGEGALSFALDPGGKISLTGLYNINQGNYLASLENFIKRSFVIESGSSVIWNGDPLDAMININAHNIVRTSAIDLVAGQLSPSESAEFRRRQAFQIDMKLRGALLTPQISFGIHLAQGERGGNTAIVNARLDQLNDDPSSLNKQVFSLLVLGRFTQENPLQTETNSTENAARATVGKFLSSQLNQLSSKLITGVDVNFDVQSYQDYSNGRNEGRTQVGVGVSKQLFNERLSVQVGGAVDVEGSEASRNTASDIAGDVTVEYKMNPDGTYRLKGFRTNQYEGLIEGQIIETGAGIIYVKDFEKWKNLFRKKTPVFDNNEHALNNK